MAEEATKNLFVKKICEVGYPTNADKPENGIVWYKEDSYKVHDKKLAAKFAKASKSLTGKQMADRILQLIQIKDGF